MRSKIQVITIQVEFELKLVCDKNISLVKFGCSFGLGLVVGLV